MQDPAGSIRINVHRSPPNTRPVESHNHYKGISSRRAMRSMRRGAQYKATGSHRE